MGKTLLTGKLVHLEPKRARDLEDLARKSGIKQSVLMRTAIEKLLEEHGYPKDAPPPRKKRKP